MSKPLPTSNSTIRLLKPTEDLGYRVHALIRRCAPLDMNSLYCNLLQCSHFADTCIAAIDDESEVVGFVSGYLVPSRPHTLFIWQVATDPLWRNRGLAMLLLENLLQRRICRGISFLETSITEGNQASWALFKKLAQQLGAQQETLPWLDRAIHLNNQQDSELLLRIGPFSP